MHEQHTLWTVVVVRTMCISDSQIICVSWSSRKDNASVPDILLLQVFQVRYFVFMVRQRCAVHLHLESFLLNLKVNSALKRDDFWQSCGQKLVGFLFITHNCGNVGPLKLRDPCSTEESAHLYVCGLTDRSWIGQSNGQKIEVHIIMLLIPVSWYGQVRLACTLKENRTNSTCYWSGV